MGGIKEYRILLDTHTFIWWLIGSRSLGAKAKRMIGAPNSEVLVSAASAWEIVTKVRLGKLKEMERLSQCLSDLIIEQNFTFLAISFAQAHLAGSFSSQHRDPFDRVVDALSIMRLQINALLLQQTRDLDKNSLRAHPVAFFLQDLLLRRH